MPFINQILAALLLSVPAAVVAANVNPFKPVSPPSAGQPAPAGAIPALPQTGNMGVPMGAPMGMGGPGMPGASDPLGNVSVIAISGATAMIRIGRGSGAQPHLAGMPAQPQIAGMPPPAGQIATAGNVLLLQHNRKVTISGIPYTPQIQGLNLKLLNELEGVALDMDLRTVDATYEPPHTQVSARTSAAVSNTAAPGAAALPTAGVGSPVLR